MYIKGNQIVNNRRIYLLLLHEAAQRFDTTMIAAVLSKGASSKGLEAITGYGSVSKCFKGLTSTCFYYRNLTFDISAQSYIKTMKLLVESGAQINKIDVDTADLGKPRTCLLFEAALLNSNNLVDYLLSKGANANFEATFPEYDDYVEEYSSQKWLKITPLLIAYEYGNSHMVESLLKAGAILPDSSYTPLSAVCKSNNVALFRDCISRGYVVDSTHLVWASYFGNDSIVDFILSNYPMMHRTFGNGTSFRYSALTSLFKWSCVNERSTPDKDNGRFARTLSLLLKTGYSPDESIYQTNGEEIYQSTPVISLAARIGRFDLVDTLVNHGAKISASVFENIFYPDHNCTDDFHLEEYEPFSDKFNRYVSIYTKQKLSNFFIIEHRMLLSKMEEEIEEMKEKIQNMKKTGESSAYEYEYEKERLMMYENLVKRLRMMNSKDN